MAWEELGKSSVVLSGRNLKEIATLFNALAITDTASKASLLITVDGSNVPLSNYKELYFVIESTLDQAPTIYLTGLQPSNLVGKWSMKAGQTGGNENKVTLSTGANSRTQIIDGTMWSTLDKGCLNLALSIVCSVAPTTGSITIKLYGTPK